MLQKSNMFRILAVFFREPTTMHYLMEISKKSKLAHTSVKTALQSLEKELIITKIIEKKGNRSFPLYKANIESKKYRFYKTISNISNLRESGLIDYIKRKLMPDSIVLFGSFAKGEDIESSDVDLFVGCGKDEINVFKYEKVLGRTVQIHFKDDFRKFPKELKNNIINGFVMEGYLEGY